MRVSSERAVKIITSEERGNMATVLLGIGSPIINSLAELNSQVFQKSGLLALPLNTNFAISLINDTNLLPPPSPINRKDVFAAWYPKGLSVRIQNIEMNVWSGYLSRDGEPLINRAGGFTPVLNFSFPKIDKSLMLHPCKVHTGHTGHTGLMGLGGLELEKYNNNEEGFFLPCGEKVHTLYLPPVGTANNQNTGDLALPLPPQLETLESHVLLFLKQAIASVSPSPSSPLLI